VEWVEADLGVRRVLADRFLVAAGHVDRDGADRFGSLGAELVPGAEAVLDLLAFDPAPYDLVVTGEGQVDETTWEGKAPAAVAERCSAEGVRCVVFGGRVSGTVPITTSVTALSGDRSRAREDLVELGTKLGVAVLGGAVDSRTTSLVDSSSRTASTR